MLCEPRRGRVVHARVVWGSRAVLQSPSVKPGADPGLPAAIRIVLLVGINHGKPSGGLESEEGPEVDKEVARGRRRPRDAAAANC